MTKKKRAKSPGKTAGPPRIQPETAEPAEAKINPSTESSGARQPEPQRRFVRLGVAVLLVILVTLSAFLFFQRKSLRLLSRHGFGTYQGYNVLIVTIDTLRADHLPIYGYGRVLTPGIDKLAGRSLIFQHAYSHAPSTLAEHTSILTGLLPSYHGIKDNGGYFVEPQLPTLAEMLKEQGYATAAFVSSYVLNSRWRLNRGFDSYFDVFNVRESPGTPADTERRAGETEVEVEKWLDSHKDRKFFAWVHYYDPHQPYDPPDPYGSRYMADPYDGEIAYTDEILGKLMDKLDLLQLRDRTIVILTSDHGESLGEHGELTHALLLYNSTLHVPLLISLPGQEQRFVQQVVGHVDIAPTILEWLGFRQDPRMQGKSLIPLIEGKEEDDRVVYSETYYAEIHYGWSPLKSITTSQYRYILAPGPELYDIRKDPNELTNLIQKDPAMAGALNKKLADLIREGSRKALPGRQQPDVESQEKLQALGYLGTTARSTPESRQIDPKDKVQLHEAISNVLTAVNERRYRLVLQAVTPILQQNPEMADAHFYAGIGWLGIGNLEQAISEFQNVIRLRPDHFMALFNLANTYERAGDLEQAKHWYEQLLKYESDNLYANRRLANLYQRNNEPEQARKYFLAAARSYEVSLQQTTDPHAQALLHVSLGETYFDAGESSRAEEQLKDAVALLHQASVSSDDRARAAAAYSRIAALYLKQQRYDEAMANFRTAIQYDASLAEAYSGMGTVYARTNRLAEVIPQWKRAIESDSDQVDALLNLGYACLQLHQEPQAVEAFQEFLAKAPPQIYAREIKQVQEILKRFR